MGDFDPASMVPFQNISSAAINTPAAQALNLNIARSGMVLLKNIDNTLPIAAATVTKVAVIGPNIHLIPLANCAYDWSFVVR